MKAAIALMVLVAAAPAWAVPASPSDILSTNSCPVIIATVTSVETDARAFGTAIVLDHIVPAPGVARWLHDGTIKAVVPTANIKAFLQLDAYVGQQVALWPYPSNPPRGGGFPPIAMPAQLQLLTAALADPKKTWCYLPAFKKRYD